MESSGKDKSSSSIKYEGTLVNKDFRVPRVNPNDITPQEFFVKYIAKRCPVVLTGVVQGFDLTHWVRSLDQHHTRFSLAYIFSNREASLNYLKTLENLKAQCGDEIVKVEQRGSGGNFGTSLPRSKMQFSKFLDELNQSSNTSGVDRYLTTQYEEDVDDEEDGVFFQMLHEYCPPPLPPMLNYFPKRPNLLGTLLPQQVNLWVGSSKEGTSSGLHHDFHDNLYILIQGKKRFTLFSPADASNLYTHGKVSMIHPNGMINYKGAELTRPDGAAHSEIAQHKLDLIEAELDELEEQGITGPEVDRLQAKRQAAMEEVMDLLGTDYAVDDFDAAMGDDPNLHNDSDDDDIDEGHLFNDDDDDDEDGPANSSEAELKKKLRKMMDEFDAPSAEDDENPQPNSFSQVSPEELHSQSAEVLSKFPNLKNALSCSVELQAGEMLYLPVGWFHEVTSFDDPSSKSKGHIAFNYWMHPPSTKSYNKPYEDDYWQSKWEEMEELINDIHEVKRTGKRILDNDEDEEEALPKSKRKKM